MRTLTVENNLEVNVYLVAGLFETSENLHIFKASLHFEKPENQQDNLREIGPKKKFEAKLPDNTAIEIDADDLNAFVNFAVGETHKEMYLKLVSMRKGKN